MKRIIPLIVFSACLITLNVVAQKNQTPVYVDKQGVLRWTKDKSEAAFFGVNYTTPFAYAYRAHKALGADLEQAIRQDVYHFARLGFDAFRVHVWDTEISDSLGNLLDNDHLRLFDFLLAELKKRRIKTIVTPIAFWGNGYPERDERTPGFSRVFGRGKLTTNDTAIRAQENFLLQFFKHINPYTKLSYRDDPDIIAMEINNEPSHSGPHAGVTDYINRLAKAVRSTGWSKPVYYNISQGPYYAAAVAKSNIDGVSFQWYPSGLVANSSLKGNHLPHVDIYSIPFDTIPEYRNKTRMVYEFDAADILQSYMYPAMARSFRSAGFQWATQFAYDPMAIAYANTEYQTHYLNLAYTPSKAISMLIAGEVFRKVPRGKNYGGYPANSSFDVFRVSYKERLSEMNSTSQFYYSNTTTTQPVSPNSLEHIAGVGSSPVVTYEGTGAYFLDKLDNGTWRLEVMPDAIHIKDPFERASPSKEVTRIQWRANQMRISLHDLGNDFVVTGLNNGNNTRLTASGNFAITPGSYLLVKKGKENTKWNGTSILNAITLGEFEAPKRSKGDVYVTHEPYAEVSANKPVIIHAKIVGTDSAVVILQVSRFWGPSRNIPMTRSNGTDYSADIPADLVQPGLLNYRIVVQIGKDTVVFPGGFKGNLYAWDNYNNEYWKTFVAADNGRLEIYNPTTDRSIRTFPPFARNFQTSYITGDRPGQLVLRLAIQELWGDHIIGFQHFFGDKLKGRTPELASFDRVIIRAKAGEPMKGKLTVIDENAAALSTTIALTNNFQDIVVPFASFAGDSSLLLPRPYPPFMPLWFTVASPATFTLSTLEKIELTIGTDIAPAAFKKPYSLEVESIWLEKKKN
jgi:hypothetical protein